MITGKTRLLCSLGDPIEHSLSPIMHNEGFKLLNLDYSYLCFKTGISEVKDTITALKCLNARGFSCTMPIKVKVCELCDELSPAAALMGAVNAAIIEDNKVIGYNTDGIGYTTSIKKAGHDFTNKKITILGGGGAATAIAVQLALDGASEISMFNRSEKSISRVKSIALKLNEKTMCKVNSFRLDDTALLRNEISESYIFTNATPVGMTPNVKVSPVNDSSIFRKDLIVTDVIYNPYETQFLKNAKKCGCITYGGLDMLIYQGAAAFELWTGKTMPVDGVKRKLLQYMT